MLAASYIFGCSEKLDARDVGILYRSAVRKLAGDLLVTKSGAWRLNTAA
jgi:hypothetical protein